MRKNISSIFSLLVVNLVAAFTVSAGVPNGYYSSLNGKSGIALKNAIHSVIRPHTRLTYSSLWNHFPSTDVYPQKVDGKDLVWDMYSDNYNTKKYYYGGGTSGLNREHSLPKSWWGVSSEVENFEAYTDINHLYPSDGPANMAKSNHPLGEVQSASYNNGVVKVGTPKSGLGGGSSSVFEPADEYKGDFARTYFYMATMYQDYTWRTGSPPYGSMLTNDNDLTLKPWAYNMLLEWCRMDPVSQKEIDRNEAVFKIQNNRNPFIDNPGLEEYIWGNKMGQVYQGGGSGGEITGDPTLLYPAPGSSINFGKIAIGKTVTIDVVIKAQNLTNSLSFKVYGANAAQFGKLSVSEISKTVAANGYTLKMKYTPTEVGEHTARLLFYNGGLPDSGVGVGLSGVCLEEPEFSQVVATPAINVSESGFTATWELVDEEIDHYNVHHCIYNGNELYEEKIISVPVEDLGESTIGFLEIENPHPGYTHTYSVQSCYIGCESEWSNTISLIPSAVDGVEVNSPLSITSYEGGVIVRCSHAHHNLCIYNAQGQLLDIIPSVENGEFISLPVGVYLITSDENPTPNKALVR